MKSVLKKPIFFLLALILLTGTFLWAHGFQSAGDQSRDRSRNGQNTAPVSVPAGLAFFGAGLITLGIYAKRKNAKR